MPEGMLKLDERDVRILAILQRDGRITKAALAEQVNLSPTPTWERLRRLERAGIIEGYGARLSLKALAPLAMVFVEVEIESHRSEDFARFESAVAAIPEITACWAVGGGLDYLLQVVTRDLEAYQRLIDGMLESGAGLRRYFTYVVTKQVKQSGLPVEKLATPQP